MVPPFYPPSVLTIPLPFAERIAIGLTEIAAKMAGIVQQSDHHEKQKKQMKERTMEVMK